MVCGIYEQPNISGNLVDLSKKITYQPDRTEAVHMTVTFFSERIDWEISTDQIKQFNCSLIYRQRKPPNLRYIIWDLWNLSI